MSWVRQSVPSAKSDQDSFWNQAPRTRLCTWKKNPILPACGLCTSICGCGRVDICSLALVVSRSEWKWYKEQNPAPVDIINIYIVLITMVEWSQPVHDFAHQLGTKTEGLTKLSCWSNRVARQGGASFPWLTSNFTWDCSCFTKSSWTCDGLYQHKMKSNLYISIPRTTTHTRQNPKAT